MENYSITKEQVLSLANRGACINKLKEWFPDAFKKELEVRVWYKSKRMDCLVFRESDEGVNYGFYNGYWLTNLFCFSPNEWQEAEDQEVEAALIAEAKKRGIKKGVEINRLENYYYGNNSILVIEGHIFLNSYNCLVSECSNGYYLGIFKEGKWVTITETITKAEAEKLLNKKIV